MRYLIERESRVQFAIPVREHHVQLRLAPWDDERQQVLSCTLTIDPAVESATHQDGFGNLVYRFDVVGAHDRLVTRLRCEVETRLVNPFEFAPIAPAREREWIAQSLRQAPRLWDFVFHRSPHTPLLPETLCETPLPVYEPGVPLIDQVQTAMRWIRDLFEHDHTSLVSLPNLNGLFETGRGGTADLSHLLIALMRGWGVPARFVAGYLDPGYFDPDDELDHPEAGPRPQTMHHWTEILIPGAGWLGFDPAMVLLADASFIRVAVGRDAGDVRPERATFKGGADVPESHVTLTVTRHGF